MFLKKERYALFRKKTEKEYYDAANKKPVIKASICNGEQVAGFLDINTGSFEEVMLISTPSELANFKKKYGILGDIEKIY